MKNISCSHCKKKFIDTNALFQHKRRKHPGVSNKKEKKPEEEDMSIADLMVQAQWDDDPEPDWVREMMI